MTESLWAVVRGGRIELLEPADLPDGARLRVSVVTEPVPSPTLNKDQQFWLGASESTLDSIWDNAEDDVYAQLLSR
jgi:hypothetical protein